MKIAVFGDSFAKHYLAASVDENRSWVEILKSKNFDITNFAEPGSCLYFSYKKFIENHEKYDKVIFCITDHGRIYLPEHSKLKINTLCGEQFLQNVTIRSDFSNIDSKNNFVTLSAIDQFWKYIYNDETALLFHNLMIEKIKNIRCDGLYLQHNIWEICYFENTFYDLENKLGKNWREQYIDNRICHITDTNNVHLSNIIKNWIIDPNYKIPDKLYIEPTESFEKYIIKS